MKINEVIVVEGTHDALRLKQVFEVDTIITNGSAINKETLSLIKQVNETRGVIVFCDPDYPGEQIRKKIMQEIPTVKHAFIHKDKAIDERKHKVGVEHATDEDLYEALEFVVTFDLENQSLSKEEYTSLGLVGDKQKRIILCDSLNIGYANAKTLYKRLNMLDLNKDKILEILRDNHE